MRLTQLETFLAIVESGSYTAASARLHVTQPALSRQVAELERELGVPLLRRGRQGAAPTPAGLALQRHAEQILGLVADAATVVRRAPAERVAVRLGLAPGLADDWLDACVEQARARVPELDLVLVEATTEAQARRLDAGELDLGLTHRPPLALAHALVLEQPLGLAAPGPGPEPAAEAVPLAALDRLRILSHGPEDTSLHHDQLVFAARQAGVEPAWVFREFTQYVALAVDWSDAVGVVLVEASARRLVPGWRWRPLARPEIAVATYLVRREGLSEPGIAFADALVDAARAASVR